MIDVRQREKTDFENRVDLRKFKIDSDTIQMQMFRNSNYGYFVSSFYGEFILQDDSVVTTINHYIKCEDYIYCFVEELVDGKYDDIMWYRDDHTQKLHGKSVFKRQGNYYILVDFMSNIKEIGKEVSVLKLINVFGDNSYRLNRMECSIHSYLTNCHALLFKKFNLNIPTFDEYNDEYNEVTNYSLTERELLINRSYERIDRKSK